MTTAENEYMQDGRGEHSLFEDISQSVHLSQGRTIAVNIQAMDKAAWIIHRSFSFIKNDLVPGVTTQHIAMKLYRYLLEKGVDPGCIIRISPEEVVWHGIPDERLLHQGELLKIDVACSVNGWWADAAGTFPIGHIDESRTRLLKAAWEGTGLVVGLMRGGTKSREAAEVLKRHCTDYRVSLIPEGAGHGIGKRIHEPPSLTYDGREHDLLVPGLPCTCEPLFTLGNGRVRMSLDGSAVTVDGTPSAHFEVTVLPREDGATILGAPDWMDRPPC